LAVATVPSPLLLDDRQSVGRRGAPSVPVALTLRYAGVVIALATIAASSPTP
jgi:hypothetical protein